MFLLERLLLHQEAPVLPCRYCKTVCFEAELEEVGFLCVISCVDAVVAFCGFVLRGIYQLFLDDDVDAS